MSDYLCHGGPADGKKLSFDKPPWKLIFPYQVGEIPDDVMIWQWEEDCLGNLRPKSHLKWINAEYILGPTGYHYQEQPNDR